MLKKELNKRTFPQFVEWINEWISTSYDIEIHSITDKKRLIFLQNLWARSPEDDDCLGSIDVLLILDIFLFVNFPKLDITDNLRLKLFYTLIKDDKLYMLKTLEL